MMTGRAGWATLRVAFHPKAGEARADALKRLAAEYGDDFAESIAKQIESAEMIERNRVDTIRIESNARRRARRPRS